jgi:hypothetical protein
MNERIRELAEQAGIQMFEDRAFGWSVIAGTDHNVQRFAELIVTECVRVCVADQADPRDSVALRCAKKIQKHFEVES